LAGLLAVALALTACGGGKSGSTSGQGSASGSPVNGGSLTVLEDSSFAGSWPTGLDPATNTTGGANISMQQAIYGGLFLLRANPDGSNARVEGEQAESGTLSADGKTLTVKLRPDIKFSDGTPLDAQAVVTNWQRDLQSTCTCKPTWQLAPDGIKVVDPLTVSLTFTAPNAAVLASFPASNVNWIASPTALQQMGPDAFKIKPVGAGPFTVVDDKLNSQLVLKKNPTFFKQGLPHLDNLTFQAIGGDQPAYQALLAGQAQAYEGMNTIPLIEQAKGNGNLTVTSEPPTSPYNIQLNTKTAPFDNEKARQAIYAATDFDAIAKGLFKGAYPVSKSFTAPGGLFYPLDVPNYQGFDLNKAKQLVQELGGLTINLGTISNYVAKQVMTALQTQWQKAGINVTTSDLQLSALVQQFSSGQWQAMLQTAGAWDPAAGVGVSFRYSSRSPFSGVNDPDLDNLLNQAAGVTDQSQRKDLYTKAAQLIAQKSYSPFGLAFAPANLATKGVQGPGLTTKIPAILVNTGIIWDEVYRGNG
jgi:peptide/nickel transport system substrate-binding protein